MSFGQISDVKSTHERRVHYTYHHHNILFLWGASKFATTVSKIISMQIVSIDLAATKFVEQALSYIRFASVSSPTSLPISALASISFLLSCFFFALFFLIRYSSDNAIERPEQHIIIVYSKHRLCFSKFKRFSLHFFFSSLVFPSFAIVQIHLLFGSKERECARTL